MPNALHRPTRSVALVLAVCGLSACAAPPPAAPPTTSVTVRIAPSAHPEAYEVQLARTAGDFRAVHTMRSGERRTFAVPKGWLTVRIPGLCVVPTPAQHRTLIDVDSKACEIV